MYVTTSVMMLDREKKGRSLQHVEIRTRQNTWSLRVALEWTLTRHLDF